MTDLVGLSEQAEGQLTKEEAAAFGRTVTAFREGLPSRQRDALTAILARHAEATRGVAGEAAAAPPGAGAQVEEPWTEDETTAFARALGTFRDGLPPQQRDLFTSILAVGTRPRADEDDVQGYFWGTGFGGFATIAAKNEIFTTEEIFGNP
jgi:hypothetical protein